MRERSRADDECFPLIELREKAGEDEAKKRTVALS